MAGFDSTSNTIAYALHFLALYPEVQERAYDEIMSEIGDLVSKNHQCHFSSRAHPSSLFLQEIITAEDCKKLKFVERVIYETLRMYPPVPM